MGDTWGALVFADRHDSGALTRAAKRGTLRRLGRGIYTGLVDLDPVDVVNQHLDEIVAHEFPGAVFVDRSARNPRPLHGELFVAHPRLRPVELTGLVVHPRPGAPAGGDVPLPRGLWLSSPARGLLDNLARVHGNRRMLRTMDRAAVQDWVGELLSEQGEAFVDSVRDHARRIAGDLGRTRELDELDDLLEAALNTEPRDDASALPADATGIGLTLPVPVDSGDRDDQPVESPPLRPTTTLGHHLL